MRATQRHVFLDNSADVPPQPEAEDDEAPSKTVRANGLWASFFSPSPPVVVARAQEAHFSLCPRSHISTQILRQDLVNIHWHNIDPPLKCQYWHN